MKLKSILIIITFFSTFFAKAESVEFESNISNVTVYRSGVRITRDAQINIPVGQTEIIFSNLTTQINTHSLQAYAPEGVDLVTIHYKTKTLKDIDLSEREKKINEELAKLKIDRDWINMQFSVYTEEGKILTAKPLELNPQEKGISVQDLKDYTAYYRSRSLEIKKKLFDLGNETKDLNTQVAVLQKELNEMQAQKNKQTGEVVFVVQSNVSRQCNISFSYISNQAGWVPIYDLKAKDTQSPIALNLKANVYQNTGIDWQQVKMSVSTGNPLLGNDRPILRPKYITFATANRVLALGSTTNMAYEMKKIEKDEDDLSESMMDVENTISDTETTREYNIHSRQTVPSSSLKRLVQLKQYDIEADYKYHCVPKMDGGVFLLAEVANWGKYNLLPGTANLFFQNTYIGQSQINSNVTADKILLSLGRDESIKVQRKRTNYLGKKKKFFGNNLVQNIEYTITVKNTKNKKINIEILDQIPIAQHEEIKIELKESSKATFHKDTGGLKWELVLSPNENKELVFGYTQKSPRDKPLALR